MKPVLLYSVFVLLTLSPVSIAQSLEHSGQASTTLSLSVDNSAQHFIGLRYQPEATGSLPIGRMSLDLNAALALQSSVAPEDADKAIRNAELSLYRLWLRLAGNQFGIRIGLQKINFGSAMLLRPLRWFDRLDPRDPLQITNGVYGLLLHYTFLNNTNIRIWGLLGNKDPKGWEVLPTARKKPEWGGRLQAPLKQFGEAAFSYHYRRVDWKAFFPAAPGPIDLNDHEHRLAADLRLDYIAGLWLEGVIVKLDTDELLPLSYQQFLTIGTDYTLPFGSGLRVSAEHLWFGFGSRMYRTEQKFPFSAILGSYSRGLLDQYSLILFYDWENSQFTRYISWNRSYDRWQFYLNGFWNPDNNATPGLQNSSALAGNFTGGKGLQILAVFNY